jgi:Ran GTPase-activating protein (RanGAP) involved in mRNA processing and transport
MLLISSLSSYLQIDLSQRGLRPSDARLVKMALTQNANLSVLKLGYNNLGDEGVTTLAAGIALHKSLVSLDLGFNNFGDEGCKSLALAMQQACQANHGGTIRTLYLAGNLIGEDGAIALADCIRQGSCLRKLYLTGNRLGTDGVKAITEAILEDELRRADSTSMDEKYMVDAENPANDENDENNDKPPTDKSSFLGMQELFFGGTGMGGSGVSSVARLLEKSSCLRVISLPNCNIGDEEVSMLASGIRPNRGKLPLETIQLSFNNMTYKGLEALINAVWGSSTLRELRLDNNEIGDQGAHQVAAILPVIKTLEVLDVGFNSIKVAGLNTLMKAVAETQNLKSLSVSGNAIDVAAAKAVAYALAYNRSLQSLYLVHCTIGHEGQRHISAGAVSNCNTALRKLTGFDLGRKLQNEFHCLFIFSFLTPHLSFFFHLCSCNFNPRIPCGYRTLDKRPSAELCSFDVAKI